MRNSATGRKQKQNASHEARGPPFLPLSAKKVRQLSPPSKSFPPSPASTLEPPSSQCFPGVRTYLAEGAGAILVDGVNPI